MPDSPEVSDVAESMVCGGPAASDACPFSLYHRHRGVPLVRSTRPGTLTERAVLATIRPRLRWRSDKDVGVEDHGRSAAVLGHDAHPPGDRGPDGGRARLAESRRIAQHVRTRRDRGQPAGRARLLDAVPGSGG